MRATLCGLPVRRARVLAAATAAGVKVALVAFGPEGEALTRLAPEALLAHFDDLPALARDWLGAA